MAPENPGNPFRVGLIGYGTAGAVFHAPLIAATSGLDLTAVVTSNPERQVQLRRDHPGAEVLSNAEQLWSLDLDLIVVATPNRTHAALAAESIRAGVAVVVDKPMATTSAAARDVAELAEDRGVPLTVFQNRRWDGDFLTVADLVRSGRLGDVRRFESRFERWRPALKGGWRELGDPAEGGGLLYDLGSHLVDQAVTLFGPAVRVYAELDVRRPAAQADDDAFVALTHGDGTRSHLWMSAVAADLGPRFRIVGSQNAYVVDGLDGQEDALRVGGKPDGTDWGVTAPEKYGRLGAGGDFATHPTLPGRYPAFYGAVVEALRGRGPMPVEPQDAVAVLRVLEAARRSAEERCVVEV